MQKLDPHAIPLESINLIEASAGTGKSWTVTLLYLRLILEKGLTVDQILVVTFTDAATKELRDDIRHRLLDALIAFETENYQNDDEYCPLIENSTDIEKSIRQLKRAKLSLDEAAIFTIHSFCQRALNESAFEAALPFDSELMDDDRDLMQQLTDDFWRRNFYDAPKALLFKLQQKSITPDSLLKDIRVAVGKPYLSLCKPEVESASSEKWADLDIIFSSAIDTWKQNADEIVRLINNPDYDDGFLVAFKNTREFLINEISLISASKLLPTIINTKLAWLGTKKKTKVKFEEIEHIFFQQWQDFLDLWAECDALADSSINHIRIELLEYLQEELPKEKHRLGVLAFDDLLLQLQKALQSHPEMAQDLRKKYQAALIDEFQDTDPVQYDIFSSIYKDQTKCPVFLVGDPKQAIYSFRGGDIHTYLNAKKSVAKTNQYTLTKNWRSHPDFISAFNTLYQSAKNPFYDDGIGYVEISAGNKTDEKLITPHQMHSLKLWQAPSEDLSVGQIRQQIADAVAGDITQTLNASLKGEASISGIPISGADIAILVRSHSQGDLIKAALNARGVASVQSSKENIFQTHEAVELISLLNAIIEPQKEDKLRRALVTELMGHNAADLLAFESDSHAWEQMLLAVQGWHYQWKQQGFLPMMRDVMTSENIHQRFMAYTDGDRRLTNTLHLAEIIHQQSEKQSLGMTETLRWLKTQQQSDKAHEAELRLESDEQLVKIVTIHKSKGLEYPIVYCPFLGLSGKANSDKIFTFYKEEQSFLEIGSPNAAEHKAIKAEEEKAEDTRLLYVALTRAKYQCHVVCVPDQIKGSPDKTALGWLITDGAEKLSGASKAAKESVANYHVAYAENLQDLALKNPHIGVEELPEYDDDLTYQAQETQQVLSARQFTTEIKSQAIITSFSGLTAAAHDESPDHDEKSKKPMPLPALRDDEFPRGPTAGNALHEIYENLDFTLAVTEQLDVVSEALNKWGFDEKHEAAAIKLMEQSLAAELSQGFSLNQLDNQQRLNEMEFYLPLERLNIEALQQILFEYLPREEEWQVVRDAVNSLKFEQVEGYLKGYIDLVFVRDGQYFVADYKSNSLLDYSPESLLPVMADSHYYLQYLLYSVALHRYLKKRIADYDYEAHFGGIYYLFIRGMHSKRVNTGGGVYKNKPDFELIDALDSLFTESIL